MRYFGEIVHANDFWPKNERPWKCLKRSDHHLTHLSYNALFWKAVASITVAYCKVSNARWWPTIVFSCIIDGERRRRSMYSPNFIPSNECYNPTIPYILMSLVRLFLIVWRIITIRVLNFNQSTMKTLFFLNQFSWKCNEKYL